MKTSSTIGREIDMRTETAEMVSAIERATARLAKRAEVLIGETGPTPAQVTTLERITEAVVGYLDSELMRARDRQGFGDAVVDVRGWMERQVKEVPEPASPELPEESKRYRDGWPGPVPGSGVEPPAGLRSDDEVVQQPSDAQRAGEAMKFDDPEQIDQDLMAYRRSRLGRIQAEVDRLDREARADTPGASVHLRELPTVKDEARQIHLTVYAPRDEDGPPSSSEEAIASLRDLEFLAGAELAQRCTAKRANVIADAPGEWATDSEAEAAESLPKAPVGKRHHLLGLLVGTPGRWRALTFAECEAMLTDQDVALSMHRFLGGSPPAYGVPSDMANIETRSAGGMLYVRWVIRDGD